jgi:hypothetical protein
LIDLSEICGAVAYWLNYKNLTGLSGLFSEASLTVPIAEYLKTKRVHSLMTEVNHPGYSHSFGRPRQIDFVALKRNGGWSFAIEVKFFPTPIQQVVNDIGRLLVLNKPGCEKFFVMAGPSGNKGEKSFQININIDHKRKNVMRRFFSHTKGESRII